MSGRKKDEITQNINDLKYNLENVLENIDTPIEDLFPNDNTLPVQCLNPEVHDYEQDIELIKIDAKETLECLANLYLDEQSMKNKNIYKIISEDSKQLADLNFSISCSKRALINCMNQIDFGASDPDLYQSVAIFQKELRETIKMVYDLQKKMKEFYKELKIELSEINSGDDITIEKDDGFNVIGDHKQLNDLFKKYVNNPDFLLDEINEKK